MFASEARALDLEYQLRAETLLAVDEQIVQVIKVRVLLHERMSACMRSLV